MKKLFILFIFILNSCSSENTDAPKPESKCYDILSRGYDNRGNYIIIKYSDFNNKRYSVSNYLDYLNTTQICEPINLTQQPL